jgi:hypothetical protein
MRTITERPAQLQAAMSQSRHSPPGYQPRSGEQWNRKTLSVASFALALVALWGPNAAKADAIDTFVYQPCSAASPYTCVLTGDTYTWEAPSSPTPVSYSSVIPNLGFTIDATVTFDGTLSGSEAITFGGDYCGDPAGFNIPTLGLYGCGGPFWTGSPSSPSFVTGTFTQSLSDVPSPVAGILTIYTSEPGTFLLLGSALLTLLGYSLSRSRTAAPGKPLS